MRVSVVGISHPALCGVSKDSGQVAFEQEAIALFTLVKRLLRPLALGDVLVGSNNAGHLVRPVPQGQFVSPDPPHISVGPAQGFVRRMLPPGVDVGAALDALDRARIVAIDDRGIRIAHPLVRRVVFSNVPAGRKQELFEKAASLRPDAPLEVRAKQAMHGGSSFEALSLLDALSARRAAHGDLAGSVRSLRHALDVARRELHRGEIDDPVGAVLIFSRKLADALADQEHFADAEGVLREALGTAPPTSPQRAHLLGVLARVADARSQPEEARRYLEEAMRVARQSDARSLIPLLERLDKQIAVA